MNSILLVTRTTGEVPGEFQVASAGNLIVHGAQMNLCDPNITGGLTLIGGTRRDAGEIRMADGAIDLKRVSSTGDQLIATFRGAGGTLVNGVRGDGATINAAIVKGARPEGDIVAVRPEYGADNKLIGYVPIYAKYRMNG